MKTLVRWGTTLGVVGSTLLATVFSGNAPVLALPEQQITQKLNEVPVFLVTNPQGVPLTRTVPANQNGQKPTTVADVFMNGQEAQGFIDLLRKEKDPKLAEMVKTLQVRAVPMGQIYQIFRQNINKPDRVVFDFQPAKQETEGAMALLRQKGQQVKQFPNVPVFIVKSAEKGYVSVQRRSDKKDVIPLFLSQKDAQNLLNQVKQQVPKAEIQVVDIDSIIKTLQEKNDGWLNQVTLVPSSDSLQYISNQSNNKAPNSSVRPASNPSSTVKPSTGSSPKK